MNTAVAALPPAKEIVVGNVYCALFNDDGSWYRASVDKESPSNQYLVNFLDYGNQSIVDLKNLKELPENLLKFPIFSIPVVPTNIKVSQMQQQVWYPVEVTGEKSGVQLVKILNVEEKVATLSSIKQAEFENDVNEALISHIEDGIYYCLRSSDTEEFKALIEELQSCPDEKLSPEDLSVASVVCAKSSDECWYRGAVSKIISSTSYMITFIDFGNSETISLENIKTLPKDFLKYPSFVVRCRINNIEKAKKHKDLTAPLSLKIVGKSEDGIPSVEVVIPKLSYGVKVSTLKQQRLPLNETSEVSVFHQEEDVFYCQMVCDKDKNNSLESKLKSANEYKSLEDLPDVGCVVCAKFTDNIWYRGSVEEVCQSSNSCKIHFIDYGNTETISVENIKILPSEINEVPILSIPIKFTNLEKLQELIEAKASTFPVQAIEQSEEKVQLVKISDPKIKKPIYTSIDAQLLSDLPTDITVCFIENDLYYVQKVSDEEPLKEMMIILQNPKNQEVVQHTPQVGEILCAKYNCDGLWYRGLIKESCGNDMLKVFFVDYGNTEEINKKDLCYLPPSCAPLPMFSIPIKLSDKNKHTSQLSVDSKYTVKRIGTVADNVQIVKVRPSVKPVLVSNMKSCKLEENIASVIFQSSHEDCYSVTKSSDINQMSEMSKLLKDFVGEEIFDVPAVDEILVVKSADKNWYRGCINATNVKPGFCRVFLVDKGTSEDIPYSDVCYVPEQFVSFPIFGIKVLLSSESKQKVQIGKECVVHVLKNFNIPTVQIVTQYMIDSLEKHHLPLQIPIKVLVCHREGEIFFLQVLDEHPQLAEVFQEVQACSLSVVHKARIGEILVAQSSLDSTWYRCCIEEIVSCDKYKVNFIDYGNSEVVPKDKLRYLSDKLSKYPPFCIAVKLTVDSNVVLQELCTVIAENSPETNEPQLVKIIPETALQEITVQRPSKEVTEEKYTYASLKRVPFPDGEQDFIIFSLVERNYVCGAPYVAKNMTDLFSLGAEITEYCNSLTVSSYEGAPPEVDEMVLAPFEGEWYRAAVRSAETDYDVLFVDFGNSEVLPINKLRRMKPEFMSLDIQAHLCELTGFQFKDTDAVAIEKEIRENFLLQPLRATKSASSEEMQVQIKDIIDHLKAKNLITS